jgi:hypothetical protein
VQINHESLLFIWILLKDAMAMVAKFGRPDLFLTITSNPKWLDLINNIPEYDDINFRPDLIARIFKLYLAELLIDIKDRHIFGVAVAHIHVVEFQKRGLPHAHIIITLSEQDKIRGAEVIDQLISAQIPDKETHPRLYEIVKNCMLHGPCGTINPTMVCMQNDKKKCSKNFRKNFSEETNDGEDGYALCKRPNNHRTIEKNGHIFDNRDVVPYVPYLSLKYNCHINVEICASIKVVKYLYKYVYKGHDRANVFIKDEIETYLDCRYVSPPEAMWHLLQFDMQHRSASVVRLQIHLEGQQRVYHEAGREQEAIDKTGPSMLQAYFDLNSKDQSAARMTYKQVGENYVWNKSLHRWTPRKVNTFFTTFIFN